MGLPGQENNLVASPPNPGSFTNISTLFAVGISPTPVSLEQVYSIDQFTDAAGDAVPGNPMWDSMDVFFKEGGSNAYICTLASGSQDSALEAALANFTPDLGPGQMTAWGMSSAVQQAVANAAVSGPMKRLAMLDAPDTPTLATVESAAGNITGHNGDQFSGMFWPWDVAPGIATDTTRTVPPTARICGNLARNDGQGISPNQPAAGPFGIAQYIQGLSQAALSDSDRTTLNNAGVGVSRVVLNDIRTYGWRTLASQTTNANWSLLSNSRAIMAILADFRVMNENFVFSIMDGAQININKYKNAIAAVLTPYWPDSLYGPSSAESFSIDVGPAVNTATTIANAELHAKVGLVLAPFAETVFLDVAKYPLNQALA